MKQILFVLLLVFATRSAAQDTLEWAPIGTQWYYHSVDFNLRGGYWLLESVSDTVINDTVARVLKQRVEAPFGIVEELNRNYYIYSKDGKVYTYIKNGFKLLYDFNVKIGDTIYREALSYPLDDSIMCFRIDSLSTFDFQGKNLKRYYARSLSVCDDNYSSHFSGWVTELFGTELFFFPSVKHVECDHFCPFFLRCYLDGEDSYKPFSFACDTIDLLLSVEESSENFNEWYLYPNPLSPGGSHLNISALYGQGDTKFYEVRDLSGKLVIARSPLLETQVRLDLTPGLYWFTLVGNHFRESRKLVVLK